MWHPLSSLERDDGVSKGRRVGASERCTFLRGIVSCLIWSCWCAMFGVCESNCNMPTCNMQPASVCRLTSDAVPQVHMRRANTTDRHNNNAIAIRGTYKTLVQCPSDIAPRGVVDVRRIPANARPQCTLAWLAKWDDVGVWCAPVIMPQQPDGCCQNTPSVLSTNVLPEDVLRHILNDCRSKMPVACLST
jgi:hypothetical protein